MGPLVTAVLLLLAGLAQAEPLSEADQNLLAIIRSTDPDLPEDADISQYQLVRNYNSLLRVDQDNCTRFKLIQQDANLYSQVVWYSPNQPANYAAGDTCRIAMPDEITMGYTKVTVKDNFTLASGDTITFLNPYKDPGITLSGTIASGTSYNVPSHYVYGIFDGSVGGASGFELRFQPLSRGCDKYLTAYSTSGIIKSPGYPTKKIKPGRQCEYVIYPQDSSKRVRLYFVAFNLRAPGGLYINVDGNQPYTNSTVNVLANPMSTLGYITSSTGIPIRIFLDNQRWSGGYKFKYWQY